MARGKKTGGRQKGSLNKVNNDLRASIGDFLRENFDVVVEEWNKADGRDKLNFYRDLLKYSVPVLQATTIETDLSKLTDVQLDYILENLLEKIRE